MGRTLDLDSEDKRFAEGLTTEDRRVAVALGRAIGIRRQVKELASAQNAGIRLENEPRFAPLDRQRRPLGAPAIANRVSPRPCCLTDHIIVGWQRPGPRISDGIPATWQLDYGRWNRPAQNEFLVCLLPTMNSANLFSAPAGICLWGRVSGPSGRGIDRPPQDIHRQNQSF